MSRLLFVVFSFFAFSHSAFGKMSKEELFRNPAVVSAKISPDGKKIAYIGADKKGISNVFLMEEENRQVSSFTTPDIIRFFWSADSRRVLILKDEEGKGRLHLYGFSVDSQNEINYTERFSSAKLIHISDRHNDVAIGVNDRNPRFHDLYRLNLDTGELTLLYENNKYVRFLLNDQLEIVLKIAIEDDGSWSIFTADDILFISLTAEDAFQTEFLRYDEKEKLVYFLDNRFSDTTELVSVSLSNADRRTVLGGVEKSDVDDVLFFEGKPIAYASYYLEKQWHPIAREVKNDLSFIQEQVGSCFSVVNQDKSGQQWILATSVPDQGGAFWLYDRKMKNLSKISPTIENNSFAKMYPLVVTARDGLELVCYYTIPVEYDKGGFVEKPIPLVVTPHGGPFKVRDLYEFNPFHQWLANCGYAALSVNFRLSSGFGKGFVNAGNGQWGGAAHFDVIDAVERCIEKGITSRDQIGIMGASYGGYEALASLTFSPEYFKACVSICGPSSLKTVLNNVLSYWEPPPRPPGETVKFFTKQAFITSMGGNPEHEEGIRYLEKCSPLHHLDGVQAPLLLIHGQNDYIVSEKESRQLFESMKKNGNEVTYLLFPDEGHGCRRFANKLFFLDEIERFLAKHLKGSYVPVDEELIADSSGILFSR